MKPIMSGSYVGYGIKSWTEWMIRHHPNIKTQIYMASRGLDIMDKDTWGLFKLTIEGYLKDWGVGNDANNIEVETFHCNGTNDEVHNIYFEPWFRSMLKVK